LLELYLAALTLGSVDFSCVHQYLQGMREVVKTALVPYTPAQMFALVADFERYPEFVPWVSESKVLERGSDYVVGRLSMHRAGVRESFTTRNTLRAPERIDMQLVQGPFKSLDGVWTFDDLAGRGTKVGLRMRFEFANAMLSLLLSRSFEKNCTQLVDAFVSRAREAYAGK
jgi:ribosome-associated toxin RatA of RatAB toxin-antitoxin module